MYSICWASPDGSDGKESACNAGDQGSIPGLRKLPGEGNGYPLQDSCLENFTDRGRLESMGSHRVRQASPLKLTYKIVRATQQA